MKHISSRILGFSLLYVLILFFIFFIQFKKGVPFYYKNSHLNVSGRYFTNKDEKQELLLPVHITSNGLAIFITEQNPVKIKNDDDSITEVKILSYNMKDSIFSLVFEKGSTLSFTTNDRRIKNTDDKIEALNISCRLGKGIKELYVPYKLTQNARLEKSGNNFFIQYKNKTFAFSKLQDITTQQENTTPFILFSKNNTFISYHTHLTKESLKLENMITNDIASREKYENNLNECVGIFLKSLENQIRSRRHNEKTLVSLISENAKQGLFNKTIEDYPILLLPKNKRSFLSSLYYGGLIENYKIKMIEDEEEIKTISSKLDNKDYSLFEHSPLIPFLANRGKYNLINDILDFVETIDEKNMTSLQLANILQLSIDYKNIYGDERNIEASTKKCEKALLERLFAIDDMLYIYTRENTIDSLATFNISKILINYGDVFGNELVRGTGYLLFNSLYSFTQDPSFFPSSFTIKQDENKKEGLMANDALIIGADVLYTVFFPENTWYTHELSLIHGENRSIFALTCAKDIRIKKHSDNMMVFDFTLQKGNTHYAILQGIEKFNDIKIHDIHFRTDPHFETYDSSGYVYNQETKTLYLKLKHRQDIETVELHFE
ncbi:MAG: hypothetical protein ACTTIZ_02860 [Treponema sp.]